MSYLKDKMNLKELLIRELTSSEQDRLESSLNQGLNPCLMIPDEGVLISTNESVKISHAYKTNEGLMLGITYMDGEASGKYSTKKASEIKLDNPKFNWEYVAQIMG